MSNESAVSVRPVVENDIEALVGLFIAVAAEGRWIGREPPVDADERRQTFRSGIGHPDFGQYVAVACVAGVGEPVPIGMITAHREAYGVADIGMLVADGWRGQGVGRMLLDAAIEWSRASGCHKVALEHWPWNTAARALYDSAGFVQEGTKRRHYRRRNGELWSSVVMGLVLDETTPGAPFPG